MCLIDCETGTVLKKYKVATEVGCRGEGEALNGNTTICNNYIHNMYYKEDSVDRSLEDEDRL